MPFKCYIYITQGAYKDLGLYCEGIYQNRMKVIGEFICDKVYLIKNQGIGFSVADEEQSVTNEIARQSCLYYVDMRDYLSNKDGYGWHISDLKIYDKPKELSEFGRKCDYASEIHCRDCLILGDWDSCCGVMCKPLTRPPQSWCYVEEL